MPDKQPTPRQKLLAMTHGYWPAQAIHVAAKLKLADLVKDGPEDRRRACDRDQDASAIAVSVAAGPRQR